MMGILRSISDYGALVRRMYHFNDDDIKSYQLEQLRELVRFSRANSRFYRDTLGDEEIGTLEDFSRLPSINKQLMMDNFDDLNTVGLKKEEVLRYALEREINKDYLGYYKGLYVVGLSSGTSGNKGIFITPRSLTERLPALFMARSGIPLSMMPLRILFLLRVFSQGFNDINSPFVKLKYLNTMEPLEKIIESINNDRINILISPPSLLRIIMTEAGRIRSKIGMIISCAEVLEKEEKSRLENAFDTRVIEIYQASEGQIGSTCRCGSLHINEDLVYVELFDKFNNRIESQGITASKMIFTNLVNYAQPLLRYELNDVIELGGKCICGSNFRVIRKIIGRNDDILLFLNREKKLQYVFPDLFSRWIITTSDRIREFKVSQDAGMRLDILIEPMDRKFAGQLCQDLSARLKLELAKYDIEADVTIRAGVIELPGDAGKFKRFSSLAGIKGRQPFNR